MANAPVYESNFQTTYKTFSKRVIQIEHLFYNFCYKVIQMSHSLLGRAKYQVSVIQIITYKP